MKILIASRNPRKIEWLKFIMENLELEVETLEDIGYEPQCSEDGSCFETNAVIKAIEPALFYASKGYIVVSDDGGVRFMEPSLKHEAIHSHIKDKTPGEFNKEIIEYFNKDTHVVPLDHHVQFTGACTVAWKEGGMIHHYTVSNISETSLNVRWILPSRVDISDKAIAYYDIIERVYPGGYKVILSDMEMVQLMESTGALTLYGHIRSYIKKNILNR